METRFETELASLEFEMSHGHKGVWGNAKLALKEKIPYAKAPTRDWKEVLHERGKWMRYDVFARAEYVIDWMNSIVEDVKAQRMEWMAASKACAKEMEAAAARLKASCVMENGARVIRITPISNEGCMLEIQLKVQFNGYRLTGQLQLRDELFDVAISPCKSLVADYGSKGFKADIVCPSVKNALENIDLWVRTSKAGYDEWCAKLKQQQWIMDDVRSAITKEPAALQA